MTQAQVTQAIWQVLGVLLAAALPVLATQGIKLLQSKTKESRYGALLWNAVRMAVTSAEQLEVSNPEKKAAAINFAQNYLDSIGVHVPLTVIVGGVESAVYTELKHGDTAEPVQLMWAKDPPTPLPADPTPKP